MVVEHLMDQLENGEITELPSVSSAGGYPLFYITSHDRVLCPTCANRVIRNDDPDIRIGERVSHYDINWDTDMYCDICSGDIDSAYET